VAWIEQVGDDDAEGALARSFARIKRRTGGEVASILRVHSLSPGSLDRHLGLYTEVMYGDSPLTRRQREMIGTFVSWVNGCFY
jgi:alkylhydroperoxidase family enzyme